jgi:hypothetical protein
MPYDDNGDDGRALEHWYRNGGKVTHDHLKHIRKKTRREIMAYLLALPLQVDIAVNGKAYKLVHGAPVEAYDADPKYRNPIHFAVWKRWNLNDAWPEDCNMIFGHTPTRYYRDIVPMEIWYQGRHIGIDCGGGYPEDPAQEHSKYGRLACLRLDDGKVFYSVEN